MLYREPALVFLSRGFVLCWGTKSADAEKGTVPSPHTEDLAARKVATCPPGTPDGVGDGSPVTQPESLSASQFVLFGNPVLVLARQSLSCPVKGCERLDQRKIIQEFSTSGLENL